MKSIFANRQQQGFTIVELLIVIVVIGILAAITIVAFNGIQDRTRTTAKVNDIKSLQKIVELYYAENGTYPNTGSSWRFQRSAGDSFIPGVVPKYASSLPSISDGPSNSGSNNTYIYMSNSAGTGYKLMRLYQPSVPAAEYSNVPTAMRDQNPGLTDRWGVWSSLGAGL